MGERKGERSGDYRKKERVRETERELIRGRRREIEIATIRKGSSIMEIMPSF